MSETLEKSCEGIERAFLEHYLDNGYDLKPSLPILVNDGTVVFASCTVSNYREALAGTLNERSVTSQPCLRLQPLISLHKPELVPWTCYFNMLGGFTSCDEANEAQIAIGHIDAFADILSKCGLDGDRVAVVGATGTLDHWGVISDRTHLPENPFGQEHIIPRRISPSRIIEIPDVQSSGLQWEYGELLSGNGVSLYIQTPTQEWRQVGNIIATRDTHSQVTGVEFGGGLEAIQSAMDGLASNHYASNMLSKFGYVNDEQLSERKLNMLNALEAALLIANSYDTVPHPTSVAYHELSNAARAIHVHMVEEDIDLEKISELMSNYIRNSNFDDRSRGIVKSFIEGRQKIAKYFRALVMKLCDVRSDLPPEAQPKNIYFANLRFYRRLLDNLQAASLQGPPSIRPKILICELELNR